MPLDGSARALRDRVRGLDLGAARVGHESVGAAPWMCGRYACAPSRGPETRRLSHRLLVMECTSVEGDVLIAALNGQVEHVVHGAEPATDPSLTRD